MDSWLVIFILGNLTVFTLGLWIFVHYRLGRQRQRAEERSRLLERFGSARELSDFLATPRGRTLIEMHNHQTDPRRTIILAAAFGVVAMSVGLAFWVIAWMAFWGDDPGPRVAGTLLLIGGLGMLLAAGVSTALAARWRLLRPSLEADDLEGEEG